MKIKNVRVYGRDLGTSRPYTITYKTVSEVIIAFVEIELENGIIGIGASNSSKVVVGESVEETLNHLSDVDFSYLIGQKITQTEGLLRQTHDKFTTLPGTHAAIDIALHDAFTQLFWTATKDATHLNHHWNQKYRGNTFRSGRILWHGV